MRVLIISNLYPPVYYGGYELSCQEISEALQTRGHQVEILTSNYGITKTERDDSIQRILRINFAENPLIRDTLVKELVNQRYVRRVLREFLPDIIFFWNLSHISTSVISIAASEGVPSCYYIFDHWLSNAEFDHWSAALTTTRSIKRLLLRCCCKLFHLASSHRIAQYQNVIFASEYLRGLTLKREKRLVSDVVIPWGIDTNLFKPRQVLAEKPRRLLYVGQLASHKGVDIVLKALSILHGDSAASGISLTLVGDDSSAPGYAEELRQIAHKLGVAGLVRFLDKLPRRNLPAIYSEHDILVFPSRWDEPYGLTQLEAMACGLAVVGTATGGAAEILVDGKNGLSFARDDATACAAQLRRLFVDQELYRLLCNQAIQIVADSYNFSQTVSRIESFLATASKVGESA